MAGMRVAPCSWPLVHCGEAGGVCTALANLDAATEEAVIEAATSYLWNWTKRQFGTCPVTVRPCRETCPSYWTTYRGRGGPSMYLPWYSGGGGVLNPALINGQWFNLPCGGGCPADKCSCNYVPTVELAGPVASVSEVLINGTVLATSAYRVDNYRYLVRTDGEDWPTCQNMAQDPAVVGSDTFQVTYNIGVAVPAGGQIAAGVLACEFAKAVCGDNSCRLPERVRTVARQGISMELMDTFNSMYINGNTGLFLVDSWIASIMASNRHSAMRVASPDSRSVRRTTDV